MNRAKFIISRSGYTTMMDIVELDKKHGVFIPTPGQTEQEYLSQYYEKQGWFYSKSQYKLEFLKDIEKAKEYSGFPPMAKSKGFFASRQEGIVFRRNGGVTQKKG